MTNTTDVQEERKNDGGLLARFWGFEELLGNSMIKLVYYLGLFVIILGALFSTFGGAFVDGGSLWMLILGPIGGVISIIFWRFFCELALLAFLTYDRLGDIKDKLG